MEDDHLLKVENLSLKRGGAEILNRVELKVRQGEVHALLGLNGSGKSSLAYTIMGCSGYKPDGGRIIFAGQDITNAPINERARLGLTLAWQEPARFEGLPTGKYVGLGMAGALDRERAQAALEAVALPPRTYAARAVDKTLSGGERKRVELAAVYAMRPKLAILDEPDSGIDAMTLADVSALIRKMAQEGTAVLIITHRDDMVAVADAASLMCHGTVVFTGTPAKAQIYYNQRCRAHWETFGAQPWDESQPEIAEALAYSQRGKSEPGSNPS
jgi:Fe-S cluster assembly ATP-binding protein